LTVISTSRLTLRDIHLTDLPAFHRLFSHADVIRYLEYGPYDEFQTREWLSHVIVTKYGSPRLVHHYAIELDDTAPGRHTDSPGSTYPPSSKNVAGWIALSTTEPSTREWALSFALGHEYWGQGYMTEAVRALVDHAFLDLSAHRIYADVDPDNIASARLLDKCGFDLEGRLRSKLHIRGEWRDALLYARVEHPP